MTGWIDPSALNAMARVKILEGNAVGRAQYGELIAGERV
jgi:hypothetical protein